MVVVRGLVRRASWRCVMCGRGRDSWSVTGLVTGSMQLYRYLLDSDSGLSLSDSGCYLCYLVNSFM